MVTLMNLHIYSMHDTNKAPNVLHVFETINKKLYYVINQIAMLTNAYHSRQKVPKWHFRMF